MNKTIVIALLSVMALCTLALMPAAAATRGNTLIVDQEHRVFEVDGDGNLVWEITTIPNLKFRPWEADKLQNGNILIVNSGGTSDRCVIEVDSTGNIVWRLDFALFATYSSVRVRDADRLPNGNMLFATVWDGLYETDLDGNVVWHVPRTVVGSCDRAQRLPNGNTVCNRNSFGVDDTITEVNSAGDIVWQKNGFISGGSITDFERLPNGNTVMSCKDYHTYTWYVIEIDYAGNVIWEVNSTTTPGFCDAWAIDRLPNGNTLIGDYNEWWSEPRIIEVDPAGNIVWKINETTVHDTGPWWSWWWTNDVDRIPVPVPDLVPTAITAPALLPDEPNTITATIENIDAADAGSFNVSLSADGNVVDTASVESLGAGNIVDVSFSWTPARGNYELCVLADSDSEVDEGDETNNELCENVTTNRVYLVPKDSGAPYCCEAEVEVWVEAEDGFQGGQINLTYSLDCANVTGVKFNPVWDFESATWWDTYEGYTRMSFGKLDGMVNGSVRIGNLMIRCTSEDIDTLCSTTLSYAPTTKLVNDFGIEVEANLIEGTFGCRIPAEVRIEPETLNLGSQGNFTAFITLSAPYDVADIDVSTVKCEGAPVVESEITHGGDTLMVKFDRQKLVGVPTGDAVTMRVTGEMQTGKMFEGRDTISVIGGI